MSVSGSLHHTLCLRAHKWLRGTMRCRVSVCEFTPVWGESPDAWGIRRYGSRLESHLVEVKVSISDFRADAGKLFRRCPEQGAGNFRWYLCPAGMLSEADIPPDWGLLWFDEPKNKVRVIRKPSDKYMTPDVSGNDRSIMYSLLGRSVANGSFENICKPYRELPVPNRPSV